MSRSKTRILGALIMVAAFIMSASFFMSKPKAAAAEEFPTANLENVAVHTVTHSDDSAVSTEQKTEKDTEKLETKEVPVLEKSDVVDTTCQHNWEHSQQNPTCKTAGYSKFTCTVCGEENITVLPCCDHVEGEWIITVQPTDYADGVRLKDCIYCDIILYFENFR